MEFVSVLLVVNISDLYSTHRYNCKNKTICKVNKLFWKLLIKNDLQIGYEPSNI